MSVSTYTPDAGQRITQRVLEVEFTAAELEERTRPDRGVDGLTFPWAALDAVDGNGGLLDRLMFADVPELPCSVCGGLISRGQCSARS